MKGKRPEIEYPISNIYAFELEKVLIDFFFCGISMEFVIYLYTIGIGWFTKFTRFDNWM